MKTNEAFATRDEKIKHIAISLALAAGSGDAFIAGRLAASHLHGTAVESDAIVATVINSCGDTWPTYIQWAEDLLHAIGVKL